MENISLPPIMAKLVRNHCVGIVRCEIHTSVEVAGVCAPYLTLSLPNCTLKGRRNEVCENIDISKQDVFRWCIF